MKLIIMGTVIIIIGLIMVGISSRLSLRLDHITIFGLIIGIFLCIIGFTYFYIPNHPKSINNHIKMYSQININEHNNLKKDRKKHNLNYQQKKLLLSQDKRDIRKVKKERRIYINFRRMNKKPIRDAPKALCNAWFQL